jgi:putative flippase GtrA
MLRRQFSSFLVVGAIATLAHYSVFLGLMHAAQVAAVPAALCGFIVGAVVNYTLNRRLTFTTDRTHVEAGWRFAAVATTGFCVTWVLMRILTRDLLVPALIAQVFTTGVILVVNFIVHRLWTFRAARQDPSCKETPSCKQIP